MTTATPASVGADLEAALRAGWAADTSADPDQWSPAQPAYGQCAVTALVVQDYCGGQLLRTTVGGVSHYLNELDAGHVDLTAEQFATYVLDDAPVRREREYVLSFPATAARYELLAARVRAALAG